jgi:hypothetical protein
MMDNWEAGNCRENTEAVDPLAVSIEETSEGEHDSDDWRVPLEYTL